MRQACGFRQAVAADRRQHGPDGAVHVDAMAWRDVHRVHAILGPYHLADHLPTGEERAGRAGGRGWLLVAAVQLALGTTDAGPFEPQADVAGDPHAAGV